MAEMSRLFNFDDFDKQIAEALEENDEAMAQVRPLRPGDIGAVAIHPTLFDWPPEPPEAA